jgi:hypothetical protein
MKRLGVLTAALLLGALTLAPATGAAKPERLNSYYVAKDADSNAKVSLRVRDETLVRGYLAKRIQCDSRHGTARKPVNFVLTFGPQALDHGRFEDRRDLRRNGVAVLAGERTGDREFSGSGRVDADFGAGKRGPFDCSDKVHYRAERVTHKRWLAYNKTFGISPNDP